MYNEIIPSHRYDQVIKINTLLASSLRRTSYFYSCEHDEFINYAGIIFIRDMQILHVTMSLIPRKCEALTQCC